MKIYTNEQRAEHTWQMDPEFHKWKSKNYRLIYKSNEAVTPYYVRNGSRSRAFTEEEVYDAFTTEKEKEIKND